MTPSLYSFGFFKLNLLFGSVEYDVDLSQIDCGCAAMFYLVALPATGSDGKPHNTDGYYYCDANNISGEWCPEYDIMEANRFSWRTTAHVCYGEGPHYDSCDRAGKGIFDLQNKNYPAGMIGKTGKISTDKPFHVKIEFGYKSHKLTLTQGDE